MQTNRERFRYLYYQYIHSTFSKEELEEFLAGLDEHGNIETLNEELEDLWMQRDEVAITGKELLEKKILADIINHKFEPAIKALPLWKRSRIIAAASILLLMFVGLASYYVTKNLSTATSYQSQADVLPGKEGAILTLSNGQTIVLEGLGDGIVTNQNGASVVMEKNTLIYDDEESLQPDEVAYNMVSTQRGRQFSIILSDGTKVWLNSASSLRYPSVFKGKERNVQIAGEAYFEVARNEEKPFKVKVNQQASVEVLGTSFNISAYSDDNTSNTTLIEGRVKVYYSDPTHQKSVVLNPGQQAKVLQSPSGNASSTSSIQVTEVDLSQVTAWKNGLFNFNEKKLKEVMKQLSRWYDIDVVYEDDVADIEFWGETSRNLNLSEVLHLLKKSGVNFRIEQNRKLIVLK